MTITPLTPLTPFDTVEHLTASWLSDALGAAVTGFEVAPVGTGQMGSCYRVTLTGDPALPGTALLKLPSADAGTRSMVAGAYRTEVRFYTEVLPTVGIRTPACLATTAVTDDGQFAMLLEDMAPAVQGDQVGGCTPEQALVAAVNLAGLHGPRWCDESLLRIEGLALNGPDDAALLAELYGPATETFVEILADLLTPTTVETLRACVGASAAWSLARQERFGLVHGDYRLDNLLFLDGADDGHDVSAVDWQTLSLGLPARDLAYLLGTGLGVEDRREHERAIVAEYHAALQAYGVTDYPADLAFDDYRFAMLQGPLVSVFGCAYGARTDRGDAMFAAMVDRACTAIRDLGTLELV